MPKDIQRADLIQLGLAIQFARLSGYYPIVVTAPKHSEPYLISLGATHLIDKLSPQHLADAVLELTKEPLSIVFDAVSDSHTQNLAYDVLAPGGSLIVTAPPAIGSDKFRDDKQVCYVIASSHLPDVRPLATKLYDNLTTWLEKGQIKVSYQ
jgi:NADPH:quinone reductase-like Zn-dependent oxidoreductase